VTAAAERAATGSGARNVTVVTMTLIGINVLIYALELAAGGTVQGTGNWLYNHGVLIVDGVIFGDELGVLNPGSFVPDEAGLEAVGLAHGEWWRLFSSAFLHYGPFHLAMNMYSLYFAGSILEQIIGRWRFVLLYLVAGLAGSAGAVLWSPDSATVGASGAIFGILGALFVLERRGQIATGGQVAGLLVLNLVITFVFSSFISVGGHIGGLVGGLALMAAFVQFRRSLALALGTAAAVAVASVLIAYSVA
jgi:membrane associated rhomboid family serine protease